MKTIAWLAAVGALVASFAFMVVSLNRWEWNRALFFGLICLIAEVAVATALVLRRLASFAPRAEGSVAVRAVVRQTRPERRHFAWLRSSMTDLNVFITLLVGGGVLLSGVAWFLDSLAAHTWLPLGEGRLARRLSAIDYPDGGLVADDITASLGALAGDEGADALTLLRSVRHG